MNTPLEAVGQMAIFAGTLLLGWSFPSLSGSRHSLKSTFLWIFVGSACFAAIWNLPPIALPPSIQIPAILLYWVGIGIWSKNTA